MLGHPADADYSAFNEPDVDALTEQLESAMLLADVMNGRRRVRPDGRGIPIPDKHETHITPHPSDPGKRIWSAVTIPSDYNQKLDALMAAASAEPSQMSSADQQTIDNAIAIIGEHVRRLREGGTGQSDIGRHACNSIDLGLIGLAKLGGG